ncbi:MAG: molybdopterin-dependent oxidoreductase, partial [Clostridiales bacterium]|nr:molybdopterin-dependent oxidoreductase [Clostridiales bacterium]
GEGCTVELRTSGKKLVRTTSSTEKGINHGNLCELGRFCNTYINDGDRLRTPKIKQNGTWTDVSLDEAISAAAGLKKGGRETAIYLSGSASNEEAAVLSGIAAALGTENVLSFGVDPTAGLFYRLYPELCLKSVDDIRHKDLIVVLGAELKQYNTNAFVAARLAGRNGVPVISADKLTPEIVKKVKAAVSPMFIFGYEPDSAVLNDAAAVAREAGAQIYIPGMANAYGIGRHIDLNKCAAGPAAVSAKTVLIFGEDPVGCGNSDAAELLRKSEFSVVFDLYMTETAKLADVVIPLSTAAENTGTFTNVFGLTQSFSQALDTEHENRTVLLSLLKATSGKERPDVIPVRQNASEIIPSAGRTANQADVVYATLIANRPHAGNQNEAYEA